MSNAAAEIQNLLSINEDLRNIFASRSSASSTPNNPKTWFSALTFGKAYRTHKSIILLCREGYGEDAFSLARTLFELMVNFAYITQSISDKNLLRYINHEIVLKRKLMNYIKSKPSLAKQFQKYSTIKTDNDFVKFIQNVDQEYNRLIVLYGESYKKSWSGKDVARMASEIGREDAYTTVYRLQCSHIHADISGISSSSSVNSGGLTLDIEASERWVVETLVVAFDFFFHILTEANAQLGWGLEDDIKKIEKRYIVAVRKTN